MEQEQKDQAFLKAVQDWCEEMNTCLSAIDDTRAMRSVILNAVIQPVFIVNKKALKRKFKEMDKLWDAAYKPEDAKMMKVAITHISMAMTLVTGLFNPENPEHVAFLMKNLCASELMQRAEQAVAQACYEVHKKRLKLDEKAAFAQMKEALMSELQSVVLEFYQERVALEKHLQSRAYEEVLKGARRIAMMATYQQGLGDAFQRMFPNAPANLKLPNHAIEAVINEAKKIGEIAMAALKNHPKR